MAESTYRVVPAVDKAARLLAELREDESFGISELARRIKASKGTVRDILLTLASHDLVARDRDGRFRRGGRRFDLTHLARPHLEALLDEFGETALLGVVTDGGVEIAAEGEAESIERFEQAIRHGPRGARVDRFDVNDDVPGGNNGFTIR